MKYELKELDIEIGKRIGALRKERRLTQETLAEKLGVTSKHISEVERGLSSLSLAKSVELCLLFDCTLDALVMGVDRKKIESRLPVSIIKILLSDDRDEIDRLNRYLRFYAELRRQPSC